MKPLLFIVSCGLIVWLVLTQLVKRLANEFLKLASVPGVRRGYRPQPRVLNFGTILGWGYSPFEQRIPPQTLNHN